mgnify:CR=1 FL=1
MKTLADIADILVGFAFKSSGFLTPNSDGIALLRGDNVQQGHIRWGEKTRRWPISDYNLLARYHLALEDVVLAMDRPIVGNGLKMAWIQKHDIPSLLVQRVCRIRGKKNVALTNYIRYIVSDKKFSDHIQKITTGANIPHISAKDIASYKITLPSINSQRKIVNTLSPYDDLIATNQRRIALLEEAAHLIYREWFINMQFPGHDSTPMSNGAPERWTTTTLGNVCTPLGGGTPSTKVAEYWNGDITWVTPTDVTRNNSVVLLDSEKKISESGLKNSSAKLLPPETILMTSRASIGYFALMDYPVCTNQGFISIIPEKDYSKMYLLFNLMNRIEEMTSLATGSTFKELSKRTFRSLTVLWPADEILEKFNDAVYPMIQQIRVIKKQNSQLAQARDLLLPKLMSGQIDVSNIQLPDEDVVT